MQRSLISVFFLIVTASLAVYADDDDSPKTSTVKSAGNETFVKECGACHTPYQADFLPAASWEKIMSTLGEHFGDSAELGDAEKQLITQYLTENSADRSGSRRGAKIMSQLGSDKVPLRLSELPFVAKRHREIPKTLFQNNPKVKSLSNCGVCHPRAAQGSYEEHEVKIPGYTGRF